MFEIWVVGNAGWGMPQPAFRGDLDWGFASEFRVGSDGVVVRAPIGQDVTCMSERGEQRLIETLVAPTPVETLDKGVLLRFSRRNVMPSHGCFL